MILFVVLYKLPGEVLIIIIILFLWDMHLQIYCFGKKGKFVKFPLPFGFVVGGYSE